MIADKPLCLIPDVLRQRAEALRVARAHCRGIDVLDIDNARDLLLQLAALIEAGVDVAPDADSQERAA